MESQAVCPKHAACPTLTPWTCEPNAPVQGSSPQKEDALSSRKNPFEFSKPSTWMSVGQIQTF